MSDSATKLRVHLLFWGMTSSARMGPLLPAPLATSGDMLLSSHLSVMANPVASQGDLGKIPPLPKEGAWRPRLPAIPSSP